MKKMCPSDALRLLGLNSQGFTEFPDGLITLLGPWSTGGVLVFTLLAQDG